MISLDQAQENIPYFVLEIGVRGDEKKFLEGIGVVPESLVSIRKNKKNSENPVVLEIHECQFMIGRDISRQVFVSPALEHQEVIFQGNKTKQREVILEVVGTFSGHFSLRECAQAVQKCDESIGEITVYRTLKTLLEKHIVEEIELPDGTKKMELLKGHHDHIFCKNCGNIIEFYNAEIEALQKSIAQENGVELLSHTMTLVARSCGECKGE